MQTLPLRTLNPTETQYSDEQRRHRKLLQLLYQYATMSLSLRHDRDIRENIERDLLLYKEIVLELRHTPPLGLTLDLIALWRQGNQFSSRSIQPHEQERSRLLLRIQNEVFYRLLRNPVFQQIQRILPTLPSAAEQNAPKPSEATPSFREKVLQKRPALSLLDKAIVYLVSHLFRASKSLVDSFRPHAMFPSIQPTPAYQHLYALFQQDPGAESPPLWSNNSTQVMEEFERQIQQPGWTQSHLQDIMGDWLRVSQEQWLPSSCVSIVNYMKHLDSPLKRVKWQQMQSVLARIPSAQNLHKLVALRDIAYREFHIPTSSTKPEGGYSGLARRGDIASLLPSELLFWDDSEPINPFFLRWVEHEALFYEREQSHSNTRHRQLCFTLDLAPEDAYYKATQLPTSALSVLFAFLARACLDLRQICPEEVLDFHIALGPAVAWEQEADLLALFLQHLPQIGANTRFQLVSEAAEHLQSQTPKANRINLYFATQKQWKPTPPQAHLRFLLTPELDSSKSLADFQMAWEELDSAFESLAKLRDHMLELILRTPMLLHTTPSRVPSKQRHTRPTDRSR